MVEIYETRQIYTGRVATSSHRARLPSQATKKDSKQVNLHIILRFSTCLDKLQANVVFVEGLGEFPMILVEDVPLSNFVLHINGNPSIKNL
jgi:hypothetical protein